ncbi:MAG: YwbE family protein [Methanotrichaceae archaeon]
MLQVKNGRNRCDIRPGMEVNVILKKDQHSNKRTRGIVEEILTNSSYHPHGIKVRLKSGQIGRVQEIIQ